jgi:TolB-like protein
MSFWSELRRRNVFKVGAAYLVVAWVVVQAVSVLNDPLGLPDWFDSAVVLLLAVGLPIALIFAWVYEVTPQGIKRTADVDPSQSITHVTGQKLNYVVVGMLALAVALMAVDNYVLDERTVPAEAVQASPVSAEPVDQPELAGTASTESQVLPNSVAVLPFANLSPDADHAYFAAGIHEEILNRLAKLSRLNVIARTSVMQYANTQKTIPEIARELNIGAVMEGSVRYADGRVLVTTQLIDAATNVHLWSESYEREFANIFAIQADIAMNVANALDAEFSPTERESIERRPTDSLEAYELYLLARAEESDRSRRVRSLRSALELDPEFTEAWVSLTYALGTMIQVGPADEVPALDQEMFEAASRAVELEPDSSAARAALADVIGRRGDLIAAGRALRRSFDPPNFGAASAYGLHLLSVGDFPKAHEALALVRQNDPLNQLFRGFYVLSVGLLGDVERADQEYDRASVAFGAEWFGSWCISMIRLDLGRPESVDRIPAVGVDRVHDRIRVYVESPEQGLTAVHDQYAAAEPDRSPGSLVSFGVYAAYFGDPEFAFERVADATRINKQNALHFWLPSMREVRQLPQFKAFIREIGLVDYWNEFGWPTICRRVGAADFDCD